MAFFSISLHLTLYINVEGVWWLLLLFVWDGRLSLFVVFMPVLLCSALGLSRPSCVTLKLTVFSLCQPLLLSSRNPLKSRRL